ncbi:MFS transporter [Novosphingobium sp.]|uniref:MFS transporter n=1 Tax=Novosphingobium sp. TaxID=1874826 RepID=UPI003D106E84
MTSQGYEVLARMQTGKPGPSGGSGHGNGANLGHDDVSLSDIAIGVVIGRTSEFFDFFVYAIASVLVFPKLVFTWLPPLEGTLASFAVFSLAFLARPVGSICFSTLDRTFGRGFKLTVALVLLGGSTAAVAWLPGYATVGYASVALLALFRLGQGFAQGGTWDGLPTLLALNAPESRRGWYAMIPQLGAPLGLIVASLLFAFFTSSLNSDDFLDWGWRYPFFVAFAINVVALFARLRIVASAAISKMYDTLDLTAERPLTTLVSQWRTVVMGAFAPLASFALFHMVTVFPLSWVYLHGFESPTRFLLIEAGAAVAGIVAMIASGQLADQLGRRTLLGASAAVIAVFSGFAPQLLSMGVTGEIIFMIVGFILLGLCFGQASGVLASEFPLRHRYTGAALTNDLAWLFGAGFAPLVALWASAHFGLAASGAYLLSGALATLIALWANRELAQGQ